jgi:hypothetical protein
MILSALSCVTPHLSVLSFFFLSLWALLMAR